MSFVVALLFSGGDGGGHVNFIYLGSYAITFISGMWAYIQLWKINSGSTSRLSGLWLWIILIVSFSIVPVIFSINLSIEKAESDAAAKLYEQSCKEVTTKAHKYVVKVCDNGVQGAEFQVMEYISELPKK